MRSTQLILIKTITLALVSIAIQARPTKKDLGILTAYESTVNYEEHSPLYYGTYSENFVNRWGYQAYCHHWFDIQNRWPTVTGGVEFNPDDIQPGDIIFVRNVSRFLTKIHQKIKSPYIMVTAGEFYDRVQEENLEYLSDKKILAWFSIHPCELSHPKLHHLPLGIIQNKEFYDDRINLNNYFTDLRNKKKEGLLFMNFTGGKKPPFKADREVVHHMFKNKNYIVIGKKKEFHSYLEDMAHTKFALSPAGTGPDTYRTWEALLVGTIPIVKTSQLDELYSNLPILIIKNWEEITEELLENTWKEYTTKKFNIKKLFIEYWWKKIENIRETFLSLYIES